MALMNKVLTVIENIGEVDGVRRTRSTQVRGAVLPVSIEERRAAQGAIPANATLVVLDFDGYGTQWSVKPGDTIDDGERDLSVKSATAIENPRTLRLSHIECECG